MSPKARVEIDRLAPVYEHELVAGLAECDRQDAVSWVYMARCIESYRRHLTATERRGPAPPGSPDDDGMEAYLAQFRGSP